MHILLIWPQNTRSVLSDELSCCEPLSLEYLAGALRVDHDVTIHDLRLDPPLETLAADLEPDLIGLAIPFTTMLRSVYEVAWDVRRLWPDTPLVVGGHHPTICSEWLEGLPADYVIKGEGGPALVALALQIERYGSLVDYIPGAGRFHDRDTVEKPRLESLAELPPPDRSLLRRHQHRYFHSVYRPVALMRFSAGCPYQCTFCSLWRLTDRRYLIKQAESIINELEDIHVDNVYVVDDEAFIQPTRMRVLADEIEAAGIRKRYHMYLRSDTALRHPDIIERWAELGLDSVLVGAESMDDNDLLEYDKRATVDQTRRAVQLFHRCGVKVRTNFIVRPSYTLDDFHRLAHQVAELEIDMPSFAILTPLPGTLLYQQTRSELISDNPELFDCYHTLLPTYLPPERFYSAFADLIDQTAARSAPGVASKTDPAVFYFSDDNAFGQMLEKIRHGHQLSEANWMPPVSATT